MRANITQKEIFNDTPDRVQELSNQCKKLQRELDTAKKELEEAKKDADDWRRFFYEQQENTRKIIEGAQETNCELSEARLDLERANKQILELKAKLYDRVTTN